jgi:hypothetical protein
MNVQFTISLGDVILGVCMFVSVIANYFAVKYAIRDLDYRVEELRRGRGLILEHWPAPVRRCFGFDGTPTFHDNQ